MNTNRCIGCGGLFADIDGPVHAYMESSPSCWAAFGEVLAREYSDPAVVEVHRLTVDAYAVQHPGKPSPQSIQSVGLHLIRLCRFLEQGLDARRANEAMLEAARHKHRLVWLEPPASLGAVTVADVIRATTAGEHKKRVLRWAQEAWNAWSEHHAVIRAWLPPR
jgi:hypothetical protein